ncbi:MAG: hypothetical protein ABIJ92_00390 [Candidatus Aenigmatarchaeota archaeon]
MSGNIFRLFDKRTIFFIKNHRINQIERFLGNGTQKLGKGKMKKVLRKAASDGLTPATIGRLLGKNRHVLHQWYKRYELKSAYYKGFKKSIIITTLDIEKHEVKHTRYNKMSNDFFRAFYVNVNPLFAYFIGLILGDGHVDNRKIYVAGGGSYDFLDRIYPKALQLGKYLGDRKVLVKYYDKRDRELDRKHKDVSAWRIYFYWSAFSNLFKNKKVFRITLETIWSIPLLDNAFTAGFFDADGYFILRKGAPDRIGVEQTEGKSWFNSFIEHLNKKYSIRVNTRIRKYKITKNNGMVYTGISKSTLLRFTMKSWPKFIDDVILPYCNKPIHINRALYFKDHSLKTRVRLK